MTAVAVLSDVWGLCTLRRCTDTTGVQCWGCGRKGWRKGDHTDPCTRPDPPAHCRWANNHMGDR